ncbi:hypothetical protein ACVWXM_000737 [Bradyrhizobium sp. GM7.3]
MRVREFLAQEANELSEAVRAIGCVWIVLDVAVADVGEGCIGVLLVKPLLVERKHSFAIGFFLRATRHRGAAGEGQRED